jgi:hypothetical protein
VKERLWSNRIYEETEENHNTPVSGQGFVPDISRMCHRYRCILYFADICQSHYKHDGSESETSLYFISLKIHYV